MPTLKLKAQLMLADEIAIGPGKADLLEAIGREGSISAAGRALGISYRRSWSLVAVMNRCWRQPLVETATGGRSGGGARLTDAGREVLAHYRALQQQLLAAAAGEHLAALEQSLLAEPRQASRGG